MHLLKNCWKKSKVETEKQGQYQKTTYMDQQILKELQAIKKAFASVATKDDLKNFATKDDLKNFATKDDLKDFATKDDLVKLRKDISEDMGNVIRDVADALDEKKADKTEVNLITARVGKLERKLAQ